MKNQKPYIYRIPAVAMLIAALFFPGCSYVMDAIEGAITERASFSIEAEYIAPNVVITWNETDSSEGFAGYEIYITKKPNDEYAGYSAIAARYDIDGTINLPAGISFSLDPTLDTSSTKYFTRDISLLASTSPGIYFFRVGIIHWDLESESERINQWGSGYDTLDNYKTLTEINSISGYAMVRVP